MVRAFFLSLAAFLAGTIIVYLAVVFSVIAYWELTGFHDREGAGAMGLAFILGPGVALPSGIILAIITFVKTRKRAPSAT